MSEDRKTARYKQCHLKRKNAHHTAWIPEKFAVVGKFIKIKKDENTWEDGWEVMSDGGTSVKTGEECTQQSISNGRFGGSIKV